MTALQTLKDFEAARAHSSGLGGAATALRAVRDEHGLPLQVQEGARLCAYTWSAGELTRIVEPDGSRLDYRYGDDGRLLAVDRNDQVWARYRYDVAGRLIGVDRADGPQAHQYDAQGRLLRTQRGDASPWVYRWADGGSGGALGGALGGDPTGRPAGRVCEARSDNEHSRFEHDHAGRLVGLVQRVADQTLSLRFDFDAAGRLRQIHFAEWQQRIGFAWDGRGRPSALSWNGQQIIQLGSDDAQRLSWSQGPDGVRNETGHEPAAGRPQQQCLSRGDCCWRRPRLSREHQEQTFVGQKMVENGSLNARVSLPVPQLVRVYTGQRQEPGQTGRVARQKRQALQSDSFGVLDHVSARNCLRHRRSGSQKSSPPFNCWLLS